MGLSRFATELVKPTVDIIWFTWRIKPCVKELRELAPLNNVLFSSCGCAFLEAFYLVMKRAWDVIYSVLFDVCGDGNLTIFEAVRVTKESSMKMS